MAGAPSSLKPLTKQKIFIMESITRSTGIKAVLFDVGGVLFSSPQAAIAEVEQDLGLPQ